MPAHTGKSSTTRGIMRNAETRSIVAAKNAKGHAQSKFGTYKVVRVRAYNDETIIPVESADLRNHVPTQTIKKPSAYTKLASARERPPATAVVSASQPGVDQFTNSVLSALKGILGARLERLAAADIDITSLGTPMDVAERLASALPASHPFDEIIGPFYDVDGVARRLQIPHDEALDRVEDDKLLGCPTAEGALVFPLFQFHRNGKSVDGLHSVLGTMAKGSADRWQIALWMNTPSEQLNDQTPAQALRRGDIDDVQELAEQTAVRWRH